MTPSLQLLISILAQEFGPHDITVNAYAPGTFHSLVFQLL